MLVFGMKFGHFLTNFGDKMLFLTFFWALWGFLFRGTGIPQIWILISMAHTHKNLVLSQFWEIELIFVKSVNSLRSVTVIILKRIFYKNHLLTSFSSDVFFSDLRVDLEEYEIFNVRRMLFSFVCIWYKKIMKETP